jgi:CelD/BcsL family acetyltransferase involved in cellulose biosynthesis
MPSTMTQSKCEISWLSLDQWQAFVEQHPCSSIFHHRNWLELLQAHYGFAIRIPALMQSGKTLAAIPFLQTRSLRGTRKLVSLPFTDYLPVLSDDIHCKHRPEVSGEDSPVVRLCARIRDEFRGQFKIVMRGDQPIPGLLQSSHNVRHELATDAPLETLKSSFANAIRRNLRKAQQHDLEFHKRSDRSAIDVFYRMHVLTRRKLGVPVQTRTYFRKLHEKLIEHGLGCVGIVSRNSVPLAAVVLLGYNGRLTYKYAASDPAALEQRPNDWLVYNAIRMATEEGYQFFDFGISAKEQDGLRRFKSKWGATESDVFYNHLLGQPDENPAPSKAIQIAGEIIKHSPTAVCRALGRAFYKYSQ